MLVFFPCMSVPSHDHSVVLCSNCACRPVATTWLCDFEDWCEFCDKALHLTKPTDDNHWSDEKWPFPPVPPVVSTFEFRPVNPFALRIRDLASARGKENLPVHMLVTVPLTPCKNIVLCLFCDRVFNHHRSAIKHLSMHYHPKH